MKSIWIVCGALCVLSSSALAQRPTGTWKFGVRGWFQEQEMIPWESELTIADTILDDAPARMARYRSRFEEGQWRFEDVAFWTNSGTWRSRSIGKGRRGDSRCELSAANGTITGATHNATSLKQKTVHGPSIPHFALAAWLASSNPRLGDTVRVFVARCLPQQGTDALEVQPFVGVVRAATFVRVPGGAAEEAWEIESREGYAGDVIIAKRDRAVLQVTTPQGSVGHSVDRIRP